MERSAARGSYAGLRVWIAGTALLLATVLAAPAMASRFLRNDARVSRQPPPPSTMADPGVQRCIDDVGDDVGGRNPGCPGRCDVIGQPVVDLVNDIAIARIVLHRLGIALRVHQADRNIPLGDKRGHLTVVCQG